MMIKWWWSDDGDGDGDGDDDDDDDGDGGGGGGCDGGDGDDDVLKQSAKGDPLTAICTFGPQETAWYVTWFSKLCTATSFGNSP